MGTDAEACAYLNTASLTMPMDSDWSQIYLYVAGKTYKRWQKSEMPDDIRVESLTSQQTADLNRLKEWLYRRRTTARQESERAERRQQKEEEATKRKAEQPALFEF
jgi:CO dehydrogenase/acetyl-CoA synthase beta subunit